MRPLFALALAAGILGLVQSYMVFQRTAPRPEPPPALVRESAEGEFFLELTLTFDAAPDDFDIEPASLAVTQGGEDLLRLRRPLPAGETIRAETPLAVGVNELYVRAWAADDTPRERAMRVRVLRDEQTIWEETLWSRPGEPVEGPVRIDIE